MYRSPRRVLIILGCDGKSGSYGTIVPIYRSVLCATVLHYVPRSVQVKAIKNECLPLVKAPIQSNIVALGTSSVT